MIASTASLCVGSTDTAEGMLAMSTDNFIPGIPSGGRAMTNSGTGTGWLTV